MNTSLFVGLCYDAGLDLRFYNDSITVTTGRGMVIADVSEQDCADYYIDTWGSRIEDAEFVSSVVPKYALTPIEERE